ncbi:UDP-galactopyranose/dTDP-fucopyranose mutase family protein [Butyrivibrio sp. WCE2006]|uniref:UDP-galactopyranose/dTDP-fucopyranose mutase family protein n=1 Tax=Butyrivibrio sp. WCE2006 TaxID=1410611 RepID=UPI0005D17C59|nr:UDP-galactopyranose mutase [Butyrivibrio sp. WCE2006]
MKYDYLVVGAGLFGCVFAHEMARAGKKVLVIDKRDHIGGNIYTENRMGINVHKYGAHIFHTSDKKVWEYINRFTEFNQYINSPVAIYHDELYNLPFNMNTFSKLWGIRTPDEARAIIDEQAKKEVKRILKERAANGDESASEQLEVSAASGQDIREGFEAANLEEQGLSLAGRDVFEKLVKGYTEKQWGKDCKELPAFIIRRLPFRFIFDNNYFNDRFQGIPIGGYTAIVKKLLLQEQSESASENGLSGSITVKTETEFKEFMKMNGDVPVKPFESVDGDSFDKILFTGMIDEFFGYKLGNLEYRSLKFETKDLPDVDNYQGNAVVNYTERDIPYTRIIEHKHFEFGTGKGTIITREYPADWKRGDEPYYPMNDEKNNALFAEYQKLASEFGDVLFGGRLGQYKYYNMDQVIAAALDMSADVLTRS